MTRRGQPAPGRGRRAVCITAAAAAAALATGVAGCSRGAPLSEGQEAKVVAAVGLRLARATLDPAERQQAAAWADRYAAGLGRLHPELRGLRVTTIAPVFDESTPTPIGALVRLVAPSPVPRVTMDLIRSRGERAEQVPAVITRLRALDVIYEFRSGSVSFLGISPQSGEASDPGSATVLEPVAPEQHRDPAFGEDE